MPHVHMRHVVNSGTRLVYAYKLLHPDEVIGTRFIDYRTIGLQACAHNSNAVGHMCVRAANYTHALYAAHTRDDEVSQT